MATEIKITKVNDHKTIVGTDNSNKIAIIDNQNTAGIYETVAAIIISSTECTILNTRKEAKTYAGALKQAEKMLLN